MLYLFPFVLAYPCRLIISSTRLPIPFCWLLLVVQLMKLPIEVTSSFRTRPAYEQGKGSEWVHLSSPHTTPAHLSPDFVTVCHQGFNTDRSDLLATTYLKIACKAYLQLIVRSEASNLQKHCNMPRHQSPTWMDLLWSNLVGLLVT